MKHSSISCARHTFEDLDLAVLGNLGIHISIECVFNVRLIFQSVSLGTFIPEKMWFKFPSMSSGGHSSVQILWPFGNKEMW